MMAMDPANNSNLAAIEALSQSIATGNVSDLMALWVARDCEIWHHWPELYRQLTKKLLGQGEPLLAYDVVAEGLSFWPTDIPLRQLQGLALSRSGATERANAVLQELRRQGATDEETLGMLGRTYKDLAARAKSPERETLLKRAAEIYGEAFEKTGGYWTGINAATMNLLIGEEGRACGISQKVRKQCLAELQESRGDAYWEYAALGEASLICGDWEGAEQWYGRAAQQGKLRFGDLQSSRRNARLILQYWDRNLPQIERHLYVPPVMVFAGHMIDRPDRQSLRFPPDAESFVASKIIDEIERIKPGFGFSSAACGSDILFLEAMLNYGAEVSVVLPYNRQQFVTDSVDIVPGSNWRRRFNQVLGRAARVITASTERLEIGGVSYEFCNEMLLGLASIRCRQLDTDLVPLAVWNGQTGDGPSGTASVVQSWKSLGLDPRIIDISAEKRSPSPPIASRRDRSPPDPSLGIVDVAPPGAFTARIVSILFADAVGFSKLAESEVPRFVEHFLGRIASLSTNYQQSILARNTWGDGLYFVFCDTSDAGEFGLALAKLVAGIDWRQKGFSSALNLRIGLHAGPVYEFDDPITDRRNYTGSHVSRAARIEPITPPGLVYASESFAALAAAHGAKSFTCDYVGQTAMAKGYGSFPTYHVRRAEHRGFVG
jgi:class 3 adenylate cyclase/tetratricopeptide (TPR) repeat protein